ncbi:RNA polymerase sigma-70 factor [Bacteroidota bacterium]
MDEKIPHTDLKNKLKSGDYKYFKLIFETYYNPLCRYANYFINDQHTSKDLVEDVFCYLWENRKNLKIEKSISSYLYSSVHNKCLNYLRDIKTIPVDEILFISQDDNNPLTSMIWNEVGEKIDAAINELPKQCKQIFELSRYENLKYKEISSKLGITINTVKTQLKRAVKKLRVSLKEYLTLL